MLKNAWSMLLIQEHTTAIGGKVVTLSLMSRKPIKLDCIKKEAYAIYIAVKKLSLYLTVACITL